jgi:hypothetical protein
MIIATVDMLIPLSIVDKLNKKKSSHVLDKAIEPIRESFEQDVQNSLPVRPQANQNRRRTLWGTLRILMS